MTFDLREIKVDPKDARSLIVTLVNAGDFPRRFPVVESIAGVRTEVKGAPHELSRVRLFMVTRRSTVNPDEAVKFRVQLMMPVSAAPSKAFLQLMLDGQKIGVPLAGLVV
jgi:hypothetical protein